MYAQWKEISVTTTAKINKTTTTTVVTTTLPKLALEKYNVELSVKEQYAIKANQSDLTYSSDNEDVAIVSKNGVITAVGNGQTVITVSNSSGDTLKLIAEVYSHIKGDANNDGKVSITDVIMLQKWLLGEGELICWQNIDLYEDNQIDVFDLYLLKRMLVENS